MTLPRLRLAPLGLLALVLAACTMALEPPALHAASLAADWPQPWIDAPEPQVADFTPPRFTAPAASHCHRPPTTREVPGNVRDKQDGIWPRRRSMPLADAAPLASPAAPAGRLEAEASEEASAKSAPAAPPALSPQPQGVRPAHETVSAGVVDDNANFGAYPAYRQRHAGLPVRERDIDERYLLEVTDAQGRPVHDAEVAVQRAGDAQPVMWARTDTAGRVWLHPRAFMAAASFAGGERVLGVAVRKGGAQARATLVRGQAQAVQVRLGTSEAPRRARLDLVFMIDATGTMGDEIAKLKTSMRSVAEQISQLPGQPDICYGLVAYRDRGDAFLTRTHDFTDDLGSFPH